MPRREFLQLADTYNPLKHKIGGFFISEKLDGTRCFWDGGVSRGCKTVDVPWASVCDPKTGKRKSKLKPIASGLWSRYGNPIMAPDWFLNCLPACPLDGELWAGRGNFQLCRSICAGDDPDPRFDRIQYAVYSTPAVPYVFGDGEIKNANMTCQVSFEAIEQWLKPRMLPGFGFLDTPATFSDELMFLREFLEAQNDRVFLHRQTKLPRDDEAAKEEAERFLGGVLDQGGEGAVIRDPGSQWTPKRHKGLLKFKPFSDAEAVITGFVAGKEGKQGNVLGKIGALKVKAVDLGGVEFELGSGLTMDQREFYGDEVPCSQLGNARAWSQDHPGETLPDYFKRSKHFRVGQTVTFKYRELSDDGVPKEGRFWRVRNGVE